MVCVNEALIKVHAKTLVEMPSGRETMFNEDRE